MAPVSRPHGLSMCVCACKFTFPGSVVITAKGETETGLCDWPFHSQTHIHTHTLAYIYQRARSKTSESASSEDRTQTSKRLTGKELPCIHMLQGED